MSGVVSPGRGIPAHATALCAGVLTTAGRDRMADALDRALGALQWELTTARRHHLGAAQPSPIVGEGPGFLYVLDGVAEIRIGATSHTVGAGDFMFFARGSRRQVRSLCDCVLVDATFAPAAREHDAVERLPDWLVLRRLAEHEPTVIGLLENMALHPWASADSPRAGDGVICTRIALTIVSAAVRSWSELGCAPESWLERVSDPYLTRALDALHADPGRLWTVESLAREATMSRSAFAESFRAVMDQSPSAYLAAVRMDVAADLLIRDSVTVVEVARRLGYESEAGFSRAFRRHTGSTPSQWRATTVSV